MDYSNENLMESQEIIKLQKKQQIRVMIIRISKLIPIDDNSNEHIKTQFFEELYLQK